MTKEHMRFLVAREMGWEFDGEYDEQQGRYPGWHNPTRDGVFPNYSEDLNACAEFERSIDREKNIIPEEAGYCTEWDEYLYQLECVVVPTCAEEDVYGNCIAATAMQRCEAFLLLKGKLTSPHV